MKLSEKIKSQYIWPKLTAVCVTSIKSPLHSCSYLAPEIKFIWIGADVLFCDSFK